MKKIIACISLVFAMSAGVTALAADADYVKDGNSYSGDIPAGYTTVLIEKDAVGDTPSEIVYVDQNDDDGLGTTVNFSLKGEKLADGTYTVKLGGHDTDDLTTKKFTISSEPVATTPATIMGRVEYENEEGEARYKVGCKATVDLKNAAYVVLDVTNTDTKINNSISFSTNLSGDGSADIAIEIHNVPLNYVINTVGLGNVE